MIFFFQWLHLFIVVYFPAVEILQHCRVLCYQMFVFFIISLQTNNCSPKTSRHQDIIIGDVNVDLKLQVDSVDILSTG